MSPFFQRRWFVLALVALACTACDKTESKRETPPASTAPPTPTAPASPAAVLPPVDTGSAAAPTHAKVELTIASVGDTMAYDKKALTVPTGAEVHLVLKNNGKLAVMKHNWVLVKPGKEAEVAAKGLNEAPDAGYVVPGPDVLAYTPMSEPQGTAEITFTAPAPGKYPYICTFPGHYVLMNGVLTVTP